MIKKQIFNKYLIGFVTAGLSIVILGAIFYESTPKINAQAIEYNVTSTAGEHWAWNDFIGWIDFNSPGGNVKVSSQEMKGVASSSFGPIYLNCSTWSGGSCVTSDFKVTNNGVGALSGYAWNDVFGWISFYDNHSPVYRVLINSRAGNDTPPSDFSQWGWNPVIGWVSFNCKDIDWTSTTQNAYCNNTSTYKLATDWYASSTSGWVESAVFDTGAENGAYFNSLNWRGKMPDGTRVRFQIAVSSSTGGPWTFGPIYDSTTTQSPDGPGYDEENVLYSAPIGYGDLPSARYFKYKIILYSNTSQTLSPVVKDVYVSWSP